MKKILGTLGLVLVMNTQATTTGKKYLHPSDAEISQNRSCFEGLEIQGCRTEEEDREQYRSCMRDTIDALDDHCKKMFINLYGEK